MQQPNPSTSVQNPTDRSTGNDPFCFAPFYAAGLKKNGGRLQDKPRAAFYFPSTMADDPPSVFLLRRSGRFGTSDPMHQPYS
jgi:hypothetical protein